MTRRALDLTPLLMPAPVAAAYIGVSESTLRTLGIPRRQLGAKRLYDRRDLDDFANGLPYEGDSESDREKKACDQAFGS